MSLITKWRSRSQGRASLEATALGGIVRSRRALVLLWRASLIIEGCVAILLVLAPPLIGGASAASFFAGALLYLLVAMRLAPGRPCGCFGNDDESVSARTAARALVLAIIGVLYALEARSPSPSPGNPQRWLGLGLMLGAIAALSVDPESVLAKFANDRAARCSDAEDPDPTAFTRTLMRTRAWRTLEGHLVSGEPTDNWREGCWYYMSYEAEHEGLAATATFGLRLPPGRCVCHGVLRRGIIGQPLVALPAERIRWRRVRAAAS
jgi:hypothetical protein